jgi:hypothetical protein
VSVRPTLPSLLGWADEDVRPYVSVAVTGFLFASFTIANSLLLGGILNYASLV